MWIIFLDEFGHEGPFLGRAHAKFNHSPLFGFGGIAFQSKEVVHFAEEFGNMKSRLLSPKYREKEMKGKDIFDARGLDEARTPAKYREDIANKASRFLSFIKDHEGRIFFSGLEKEQRPPTAHSSQLIRRSALRSSFRILNRACIAGDCDFMLIFDSHDNHFEKISFIRAIVLNEDSGKVRIKDVPYDLDSKDYQTIQAADWMCTLLFRVLAYEINPAEWTDQKGYFDRFRERIREIEFPGSSLRRRLAPTAAAAR